MVNGDGHRKRQGRDSKMDCCRVLISNGHPDQFVLQGQAAHLPGKYRLCSSSSSQFAPQGQRRFYFFPSPPLIHNQCCSSFLFSFFFLQQSLSQPFVSPASDSAGHSMSLSQAISQRLFPLLSQSSPLARQPYQSQSPFQTQNGTQRRAPESPLPFCRIQQGRPS